jgi:hypothetical protein
VVGEGSMPRAPEAEVEAEVVACGTASGNRGELDAEDSAEVEWAAATARRGKAATDSRRGVLFFEESTSGWGGERGGGGGGDEEGIIHRQRRVGKVVINGNVEIGAPVIWTWVSQGGLGLVDRGTVGRWAVDPQTVWVVPSRGQQHPAGLFGVLLLAARCRTLQRASGQTARQVRVGTWVRRVEWHSADKNTYTVPATYRQALNRIAYSKRQYTQKPTLRSHGVHPSTDCSASPERHHFVPLPSNRHPSSPVPAPVTSKCPGNGGDGDGDGDGDDGAGSLIGVMGARGPRYRAQLACQGWFWEAVPGD